MRNLVAITLCTVSTWTPIIAQSVDGNRYSRIEDSRHDGDPKLCNDFIQKDREIEPVEPVLRSTLSTLFEKCPDLLPEGALPEVTFYRIDIDNDGKVDLVYFESWKSINPPAQTISKLNGCNKEMAYNGYPETRIIRLSGKTYIENDIRNYRGFPGQYFPGTDIYEAPWSTPLCGYVDKGWNAYEKKRTRQ